jgi:coenzyme PQQ precursor peptide PqqA
MKMTRSRWRLPVLKWEVPYAIDLRFGMEITMYIANR